MTQNFPVIVRSELRADVRQTADCKPPLDVYIYAMPVQFLAISHNVILAPSTANGAV